MQDHEKTKVPRGIEGLFRHECKIYVLVTLFTCDLDCGHGDVRLLGMEVSENKNLEPFDEQKSRVYNLLRQCCDLNRT